MYFRCMWCWVYQKHDFDLSIVQHWRNIKQSSNQAYNGYGMLLIKKFESKVCQFISEFVSEETEG